MVDRNEEEFRGSWDSPILRWFPAAPRGPWSTVPEADWNDWRWQFRHRIKTEDDLERIIRLTEDERRAIREGSEKFRLAITPYYASLMNPDDPMCPIRRQAVPAGGELEIFPDEMEDPLAEERDMRAPGVTHRYPDRVLFYVSPTCAMYCRHCTRKRKVSRTDTAVTDEEIALGIEYIRQHREVRDVVISGGDPLTLDDDRVERIVAALRAIPHVEILRLGTRVPVTLPQRITPDLVERLRKYQPLYINTHFNHPKECTREAYRACALLADAGFPIGNQMVLLRGVNDNPDVVKTLNHRLLMMRVKPYYIYICDMAQGISHFRTPLETGLIILESLRGWTSGLAVPYLVVDAPGGGGKIPLLPEYVVRREGRRVVLRNFRNQEFVYPEPDS